MKALRRLKTLENHYRNLLSIKNAEVGVTSSIPGANISFISDGGADVWSGRILHPTLNSVSCVVNRQLCKFVEMRYDHLLISGEVSLGDIIVFHCDAVTVHSVRVLEYKVLTRQ